MVSIQINLVNQFLWQLKSTVQASVFAQEKNRLGGKTVKEQIDEKVQQKRSDARKQEMVAKEEIENIKGRVKARTLLANGGGVDPKRKNLAMLKATKNFLEEFENAGVSKS